MAAEKLQRIDTLTAAPVVGRFYLVPTVRHPWHNFVSDWPVMGPKHDDDDLRFSWRHYHVDTRFLTASQAHKMHRVYTRQSERALNSPADSVALAGASAPLMEGPRLPPLPDPVFRRRVCRQDLHAYPLEFSLGNWPHAQMHKTYAGRPCGKNAEGLLICPHKGFVLNSLVPDERGRVVCPLHGLVIDVSAGVVVSPEARHGC